MLHCHWRVSCLALKSKERLQQLVPPLEGSVFAQRALELHRHVRQTALELRARAVILRLHAVFARQRGHL